MTLKLTAEFLRKKNVCVVLVLKVILLSSCRILGSKREVSKQFF